jgi:hypothetical protein
MGPSIGGRDYRHRLVVTEARVKHLFTQRFDRGYCRGPCFSFDNRIDHGQSGGPIISEAGRIVGLNSCDVSVRYPEPTSLGSMLYPLLLTNVRFGAKIGGGAFTMNLNASRPLFDLVMDGVIASDGSVEHVGIRQSEEEGTYGIGPRVPIEDHDSVYEDFSGFQDGRRAKPLQGEYYRFTRPSDADLPS